MSEKKEEAIVKGTPASAKQRNFHLNSMAGIKNLHVVEFQASNADTQREKKKDSAKSDSSVNPVD